MILRYDSNAFYSIGSIFIVTLIFYLLIDLESNHVKRYLPPTKVATNPRDTLETNGGKHEMETPSKRKKFSSLKELKEAAKVALDTCLCSSKQRSSWFGHQVGKLILIIIIIPTYHIIRRALYPTIYTWWSHTQTRPCPWLKLHASNLSSFIKTQVPEDCFNKCDNNNR